MQQPPPFNQGQPPYTQYPQHSVMPPPVPQKKRPWYYSPIGYSILIIGILTLCLSITGCGGSAQPPTSTSSIPNIPTPTATVHATVQPTNTHAPITQQNIHPTPTHQPTHSAQPISSITHSTPRLAGPVSDFLGKYGKPSVAVTTDGSQTWITRTDTNALFINARPDSQGKVTYIAVIGPDSWNTQQTTLSCTQFLPSDAIAFNKVSNITDYHSHAGMVVLRIEAAGSCTLYLAEQ